MKQVLVLNGPNLAGSGSREPDVYGTQTFDDLVETCRLTGRTLDLHVEVRQTDDEAEMIAWVQRAGRAGCRLSSTPPRSRTTPTRCATRSPCAPRRWWRCT